MNGVGLVFFVKYWQDDYKKSMIGVGLVFLYNIGKMITETYERCWSGCFCNHLANTVQKKPDQHRSYVVVIIWQILYKKTRPTPIIRFCNHLANIVQKTRPTPIIRFCNHLANIVQKTRPTPRDPNPRFYVVHTGTKTVF